MRDLPKPREIAIVPYTIAGSPFTCPMMTEALSRVLLPSYLHGEWIPVSWDGVISQAIRDEEMRLKAENDLCYHRRLMQRYQRRLVRHNVLSTVTCGLWSKVKSPPEKPGHVPPQVVIPPATDIADLAFTLNHLIKEAHLQVCGDRMLTPSPQTVRMIINRQKQSLGY